MDKKILDYRLLHHRCKYCKYLTYVYNPCGCGYTKCILKDKVIFYSFRNIRGMFCDWYDIDENK